MKHQTWNLQISTPNLPRALEKGTGSSYNYVFTFNYQFKSEKKNVV